MGKGQQCPLFMMATQLTKYGNCSTTLSFIGSNLSGMASSNSFLNFSKTSGLSRTWKWITVKALEVVSVPAPITT
jgi:hypothetical protein